VEHFTIPNQCTADFTISTLKLNMFSAVFQNVRNRYECGKRREVGKSRRTVEIKLKVLRGTGCEDVN
jgi:hypothetical protein